MKKVTGKTAKLFAMVMLLSVCLASHTFAAAQNVDLNGVNPAWLNQQIELQVNGLSWKLNINLLADPNNLDVFLKGVNTELAKYSMDDTSTGTTQKLCYQLSDDFRSWLVTNLQVRLAQSDISTVVINLADNHLKLIKMPITLNFMEGYTMTGSCETSYATSSSNRCKNVEVAAARFNQYVVQPGQVVSVSDTILPRTRENGYLEAGAYENGETVMAIGGGICQVSSTIYNAVMNAGLTVIERYPHSMPVHYLPLGQDAAISAGALDMKFRNDYNAPVVIMTQTIDKKLTVAVFVPTASLQGRSYRLWAQSNGPLAATSYLTTYVNGVEVQTVKVANSKYKPHA